MGRPRTLEIWLQMVKSEWKKYWSQMHFPKQISLRATCATCNVNSLIGFISLVGFISLSGLILSLASKLHGI